MFDKKISHKPYPVHCDRCGKKALRIITDIYLCQECYRAWLKWLGDREDELERYHTVPCDRCKVDIHNEWYVIPGVCLCEACYESWGEWLGRGVMCRFTIEEVRE